MAQALGLGGHQVPNSGSTRFVNLRDVDFQFRLLQGVGHINLHTLRKTSKHLRPLKP